MSRRLRPILIAAVLIVGTWMVMPADAQGRFWVLVNGALRYNGVVQVGNGTAVMPSVGFASETGLGLYRISSGILGIANDQYNAAAPLGTLSSAGMTLAGTSTGYRFTAGSDGSATADTMLSRAGVGQFGWTAVLFANLGTPGNGSFCYCSDCTIASPCASGGTGALAKRLNGVWVCN